jgi:hypothetical protein
MSKHPGQVRTREDERHEQLLDAIHKLTKAVASVAMIIGMHVMPRLHAKDEAKLRKYLDELKDA